MADSETAQSEAVSILIDVPVAEAWSRLEDLSLAHCYVPRLTATEIVSSQRTGQGTHRRVYSGKRFLEETVTQWNPGAGFVIRLHKGDKPMPPFHKAEFEYAILEGGAQQTQVVLSMRVVMPGGGVGRFLASKFIMPVVRKNLVQVAAGMKHFYETGEPASDADRKRLTGAVNTTPVND